MAKIEDLIDEIADLGLRERIAGEVRELKRTKRFGLVFEEHIPETVSLYGLPIREGLMVQNRTTPDDLTEFRVLSVEEGKATLAPKGASGPETRIDVADPLVVKRFHELVVDAVLAVVPEEVPLQVDDQLPSGTVEGRNRQPARSGLI